MKKFFPDKKLTFAVFGAKITKNWGFSPFFGHLKNGIVFVSGEPGSGKSFLINNVLNCLNNKQQIIKIKPSPGFNDNSILAINHALSLASGVKADNSEILNGLAKESIVFIEDYEMWWKRTANGFDTISEWENIFSNFSKDILFIVECNLHFLKLINQVSSINNWVSSSIYMQPLNSFEIQKTITEKNNISGMIFNWKNQSSIDSKKRHLNRLFSRLNRLSSGNIRWASLNWMASISNLNENNITVSNFKQRSIPGVLDSDWDLILLQIILHKSIHLKDLFIIFYDYSNEKINESVGALVRIKFLNTDHGNLTINPYFQSYVIQYLYDKKLLF